MKYISTRNASHAVSGTEAIVRGISKEGGLFVPLSFPKISLSDIKAMANTDYYERAATIISKFLPEIGAEALEDFTYKAYNKFSDDPGTLIKADDIYFLELWHGPTFAFKDVALTLLPYLLTASKKVCKVKERTLILVATSGDTGKAALEGFKDVEGTDIIVLFPEDGVSKMQKLQMMTQRGGNVKAYAIKGNFDDAQNAVKRIFADKELENELGKYGYNLSSANSINWGRLVPQIVYYFSAYSDMVEVGQIKLGDKINFCVPSGNFGNILAGYYAKKMGLPVNKLICASNKNNVLSDFINSGEYDIQNRQFHKTTSPSMDILISSNLERLVFELSGRNDKLTLERMQSLKENNTYSISKDELALLKKEFDANYSSEEEVAKTLKEFFDENGYIMDTHTAVAVSVYKKYVKKTSDKTKTVIVSTASPYKFTEDVLKALGVPCGKDEMQSLKKLESETALPVPEALAELLELPLIHKEVISPLEAAEYVKKYCKDKA